MIKQEEFEENINNLIIAIRFLRCFTSIETLEVQKIIQKLFENDAHEPSLLLQEEFWKILEPKLKELPLWSIEMVKFFLERRPKEIFNLLKELLERDEKSELFIQWLSSFLNYLLKTVKWHDPDVVRRIEKLTHILDMGEKAPFEEVKQSFFGTEDYFKGEVGLMWLLTPHISLPNPLLLISNRLELILWEKERCF